MVLASVSGLGTAVVHVVSTGPCLLAVHFDIVEIIHVVKRSNSNAAFGECLVCDLDTRLCEVVEVHLDDSGV